jgi:inosine-uridine nucleoside N-ribohydrolase
LRRQVTTTFPFFVGSRAISANNFTQAQWASVFPEPQYGWRDAIGFTFDTIRKNTGEITFISTASFSNVGALIDEDQRR